MITIFGMSFEPGTFLILCLILGCLAGYLSAKCMRPVVVMVKHCIHTIPKEDVDAYMASPEGKKLVAAILSGEVQPENDQDVNRQGPGGVEM